MLFLFKNADIIPLIWNCLICIAIFFLMLMMVLLSGKKSGTTWICIRNAVFPE